MRTGIAALALALVALTAALSLGAPGGEQAIAQSALADAPGDAGGPAVLRRTLKVFPLYRPAGVDETDYLKIDEGLKDGTVTVSETGEGGSVPTLAVSNRSEKPLYVCAGEIFLGGQQDRVCSHDVIVKPGEALDIEVHCVEPGRWGGAVMFDAADSFALPSVRAATQSNTVGGQSVVWAQVGEENAQYAADAATTSFRETLASEKAGETAPYLEALEAPIAEDADCSGVAVLVNEKLVIVDAFRNPALFHKLWPKLLRAYALDAVAPVAADEAEPRPTVGPADIAAFLRAVEDMEQHAFTTASGGFATELTSPDTSVFGFAYGLPEGTDAQLLELADHVNVIVAETAAAGPPGLDRRIQGVDDAVEQGIQQQVPGNITVW